MIFRKIFPFNLISFFLITIIFYTGYCENFKAPQLVIKENLSLTVSNYSNLFKDPKKYSLKQWIYILERQHNKNSSLAIPDNTSSDIHKSIYYNIFNQAEVLQTASDSDKAKEIVKNAFNAKLNLRNLLLHFANQKENWISGDISTPKRIPTSDLEKLDRLYRIITTGLMFIQETVSEIALWRTTKVNPSVLNNGPYAHLQKQALWLRKFGKTPPLKNEIINSEKAPFYLNINPKFSKDSLFRSGDVFVVRGNNSVSAGISRITDTNGPYSHVGVYIDDPRIPECKNGPITIEALIEEGVVVASAQNAIFENNSIIRMGNYRLPDSNIAKEAAYSLYNLVKERGKIKYDMAMDAIDPLKWFCAEVSKIAYEKYNVHLPTFPSSFKNAPKTILMGFTGVTFDSTFAPSDVITTLPFDLVFEFNDPSRTAELRMNDAILDAIFTYMNDLGFEINMNDNFMVLLKIINETNDMGVDSRIEASLKDRALIKQKLKSIDPKVISVLGALYTQTKSKIMSSTEIQERLKNFLPDGMTYNSIAITLYLEGMLNEMAMLLKSQEAKFILEKGRPFSLSETFHIIMLMLNDKNIWPFFAKPKNYCKTTFEKMALL